MKHSLPPATDPELEVDGIWPEDNTPGCHRFRVDQGQGGRLDKLLAQLLPQHSRGRLQAWIEGGHVQVNGTVALSVRHRVFPGDILQAEEQAAPQDHAFVPQADIAFTVLAESEDWLVVDKPVGLVVHPGAGNWQGTLLNGLLYRYPELAQVARAGIVHRLDKDTSGVMVVARTPIAQTALVRQLQERTVGREYLALAQGHLSQPKTLTEPIGRDRRVPVRMSVSRAVAPKPAITHVQPLRHGHWRTLPVTWVQCRLETGRTHQIRVHLSHLGFPLLGDTLYGGKSGDSVRRQMLHAWRLRFLDPRDGQPRAFESPIAPDMAHTLTKVVWEHES